MSEYIKREKIRESYEKLIRSYMHGEPYIADWRFDEMIKSLPAADVIPVRHGSIIETIEDGHMKRVFSCCGTDFTKTTCWMAANYCPNCGAKIDTVGER